MKPSALALSSNTLLTALSRVLSLVVSCSVSSVVSATAFAAPTPIFTDSGTSSLTIHPAVEGLGETYIKTETRYLEMGYPTDNVLKAVVTTKRYSGAEGSQGKVALEMRTNDKGRLDKVLWTTSLEGEKVEVLNEDFVAVTTYGCCGASNTIRLLNAKTGNKIEAALEAVYELEVPNTHHGKRYLALAVDSKAPAQAKGKSYVGTFSYFSADRILSRMRVYADLPRGWATNFSDFKVVGLASGSKLQVFRDTKVTLWDTDGVANAAAAFRGVALDSKLYYSTQEESVRIVINQDTIDAQASKGTAGIHLELVK